MGKSVRLWSKTSLEWALCSLILLIKGRYITRCFVDYIGSEVGGGVVFVLLRRSRKVVPEELATLMSWDPRDFLSCLVIVGR